MITSEMIYQNLVASGKTQKVLELVGEIQQAKALLQEKLFQLNGMINDRSASRKIPQMETKLLPEAGRTYRKYTDEFRADAVNKVLKERKQVTAAAKELGIPRSMLYLWINTAKEQHHRKGKAKRASGEVQLSPRVLSAYNALAKVLDASKDPVPVAKIMKLPGQSKAAMTRALNYMKASGEAIHTREGNKAFYEWNQKGKRNQEKKVSRWRAPNISVETNPLYNDPTAIALREEMQTTKRTGSGVFPKEFSEKLRAFAREKYSAGASTGQIAHSLSVAGPSVQRWLQFGIYAKKPNNNSVHVS